MTDPLTILGLTSSIIQISDAIFKAIKKCREIYKNGSTADHAEMQTLAKSLVTLRQDIDKRPSEGETDLSDGDREILELSKNCTNIASKLVDELQILTLDGDGRPRWWQAVALVYKAWRKRGTLDHLQRLSKVYQKTLDSKVLSDLR